ncbi:MAG: hypothetical protein HUU22_10745 [Phycisphaerae bacterium]|nr:hypothetical protein [Phycisphaerae bacterium]NUQ46499.1 hypothetical protein [Phycisphaerae bacterium]
MASQTPSASGPIGTNGNNGFYVGYLPAPATYVRFVRRLVPAMAVLAVVVSAGVAMMQRDPGTGAWETERIRAFEGVVDAAPYAMIRTVDANAESGMRTILLVREGKFGAVDKVEDVAGRFARVRGTVLQRDGRMLLELVSGDEGVQTIDAPTPESLTRLARPRARSLGRVTLRGEIIDPKCFFGAMKPGEGKLHKECATLCIAGGIPPMLRTSDAAGGATYHLLVGAGGEAVNDAVLPFVADPIEITGDLERCGDITLLRIDPHDIRRL